MSRWLQSWNTPVDGRPTLVCLPQAGAGCGQFRPWQQRLAPEAAVLGVQLPGREERWSDPPARDVDEVADAVAAALLEVLAPGAGLVVFGHSFGGLLGYEITRRLGHVHGRWPRALVVTACRPPRNWEGAGGGLVDDDRELRRLLDDRGLDLDEEMRELVLEVLRQDARLSASYLHRHTEPLPVPVHAWGGDDDRTVSPAQLDGWGAYTAGAFERRQFTGGHHFFTEHADTVLAVLAGLLLRPEPVQERSEP